MSEQVRIVRSTLEQQVQDGWKKDKLAEHYGLPMTQMTQVLKEAGLKIRKFHKPKYVLVDEVEQEQIQDEGPYEALAVEAEGQQAYEEASASAQSNETGVPTPAPQEETVSDTDW